MVARVEIATPIGREIMRQYDSGVCSTQTLQSIALPAAHVSLDDFGGRNGDACLGRVFQGTAMDEREPDA